MLSNCQLCLVRVAVSASGPVLLMGAAPPMHAMHPGMAAMAMPPHVQGMQPMPQVRHKM